MRFSAGEMLNLDKSSPIAIALTAAIHTGQVEGLTRLLTNHPGLAAARLSDPKGGSCSLLHLATDWPGFFANGPMVISVLISAGADPNAAITGGGHSETPLHWAASSDDVEVAAALIAGGANIESKGGSIAGGTPLDNAVGYGCWRVARLLVERGAKVDKLWHAAALGLMERIKELVARSPQPTSKEVNDAFWQACHGGQRRAAEFLYDRGADINWMPSYAKRTALEIATTPDTGRQALATWLRQKGNNASSP